MQGREDHWFLSDGTRCAGWLYRPPSPNPPVVVMAHGFGGERRWRLPAFAERFVGRGLAVFLFDYRNFGDSEGQPRNLIDPWRHVRDWRAAVRYVRTLDDVGSQVGLWGTSFSGGHVIETAAVERVDAVVAQVPFVDGLRTTAHLLRSRGIDYGTASVRAALCDIGRAITGREPHCVPLVGEPDEFALLNTPDALSGVEALVPDGASWTNQVPARVVATLPFYRPLTSASQVECPVFVAQAERDTIIPRGSVDELVTRLDDVERVRIPVGHFDAYRGEPFHRLVARQGQFLVSHLSSD